jgi:hypothetical protein
MSIVINTESLKGTQEWAVSVNYGLKGLFDSREEAELFIKHRELRNAEIKCMNIVGIKSINK